MPPESSDLTKPGKRRLTRRAFLVRLCGGGIAAVGTAGVGGVYARYVEPFWPVVERHPMDFPGLDPALEGLRLLQLSDLHVYPSVPLDYLRGQIRRCETLAPDVIVITGDFITAGRLDVLKELVALLRPLQAPLGVFAVLGNHDFGVFSPRRRSRGPAIGECTHQALAGCGVTVLRNEARVLTVRGAPLQLVGIDDLWSGLCDPDLAFAQADPELPTIVLTHNPDTMPLIKGWPWRWLLCGHTHGGQVRIPFFGAPILPIDDRRYDAGLFELGDRRLYVNRGLGYFKQVRFNCRPEITEFTLTRCGTG